MGDSEEDAVHFSWVSCDVESHDSEGRKGRRRSSVETNEKEASQKRRYSCGSFNDGREVSKQSIRPSSTLGDVREVKSPAFRQLNNNNIREHKYTSEEKKSAWSRGHNDSGILTSFDSSRFSSINNISSIDALLDERKVNAEEILTNLGFAPDYNSLKLEHRIPSRFLRASTREKGLLIERFVNSNADQFQELLSRRQLLNMHRISLDDGNRGRPCDYGSFDASSDPGASLVQDPQRCSSPTGFTEETPRMINNESLMRLMSVDLPPRFVASLNSRVSHNCPK